MSGLDAIDTAKMNHVSGSTVQDLDRARRTPGRAAKLDSWPSETQAWTCDPLPEHAVLLVSAGSFQPALSAATMTQVSDAAASPEDLAWVDEMSVQPMAGHRAFVPLGLQGSTLPVLPRRRATIRPSMLDIDDE